MKVGILAGGGVGTRLAEETEVRPKPMVEIGGMPILWHITMHYHRYGHREFAIPLGHYSSREACSAAALGQRTGALAKNGG